MSLRVLVAMTGPAEAVLVSGLERGAAGSPDGAGAVRVVRRCADLAELTACAAAGLAQAAVVSADLHGLDGEALATLSRDRVAALVLVPLDAEPAEPARWRSLGAAAVLPLDASATSVARELAQLVAGPQRPADGGRGDARRSTGPQAPEPADAGHPLPAGVVPAAEDSVRTCSGPMVRRSHPADPTPARAPSAALVAVWGPAGAPGRTTVATTVAAELARAGRRVLLVDADTYGASIAQLLGLLDESAGLAAAVRAANQGLLDVTRLAWLAPPVLPGLHVLTGLPRPGRWSELRPSGLETVWRVARQWAEAIVVDCGFCLEEDEELSYDTTAPRRNQATTNALAAADVVLAVGAADPVGVQRLVRQLPELAALSAAAPQVVLNRVRASAVGPGPGMRLQSSMQRYAGQRAVALVPDDPAALDAAMLAGRTLTEATPRSAARAALRALADRLAASLDAGTDGAEASIPDPGAAAAAGARAAGRRSSTGLGPESRPRRRPPSMGRWVRRGA